MNNLLLIMLALLSATTLKAQLDDEKIDNSVDLPQSKIEHSVMQIDSSQIILDSSKILIDSLKQDIDSTNVSISDSSTIASDTSKVKLKGKEKREFKKQQKIDKKVAKYEKMLQKPQRRHVLTLKPIGLVTGTYSLDYEYRFSGKSTVGVNVGLPKNTSRGDTSTEILTDETRLNFFEYEGQFYRAHYRYYPKKRGAPRGLYFEPYVKYKDFEGIVDGTYYDRMSEPNSVIASLKFSGLGGGVQIGSQFLIGNRVVIDLALLGLDFTAADLDILIKDRTSSSDKSYLDDMKENIEDSIEDLDDIPILPNYSDRVVVSGGSEEEFIKIEGENVVAPFLRFAIGVGFAF